MKQALQAGTAAKELLEQQKQQHRCRCGLLVGLCQVLKDIGWTNGSYKQTLQRL
jgi:hypothetical protein